MPTLSISTVGDSNTLNGGGNSWTNRLKARLEAAYPGLSVTANAHAFGGITTNEMLATYLPLALADDPDIIAIMAGTNDLWLSVTLVQFQQNLQNMINMVAARRTGRLTYNGEVLFLLMANPAAAELADGWLYYRVRNDLISTKNALLALATSNGLPSADIFTGIEAVSGWKTAGDPAVLLSDGVHFNDAGYDKIASLAQAALVPYLNASGTLEYDYGTYSYTGRNIIRPADGDNDERLVPQGYYEAIIAVRQQIVSAVEDRLQTILTASGYRTNLGSNIFTWKQNPFASTELPGADIKDGGEDTRYIAVGQHLHTLSVDVKVVAATEAAVRNGIADVMTAVGLDVTFGGLAEDTAIQADGTIDIASGGESLVYGSTIKLTIEYATTPWTP